MKRTRLKYLRNKKGLLQPELAKLLEIPSRQYGRIERGELSLTIPICIKLVRILGVEHMEDILEEEELLSEVPQ